MATTINHVECLKEKIFSSFRQDLIDLYDNTGKEESKFFPILNYSAMRVLLARDYDGCTQRAMEWINDNLEYIIAPASPNNVNSVLSVSSVLKQSAIEGGFISHGKFTTIGWRFTDMHLLMEVSSTDMGSSRRLIDVWHSVLMSVEYALSDVFGETLSNRKKELDAFPSMKRVLRLVKEYKKPNILKAQAPIILMIDKIRKRCDDDIIFPVMPYGHFYFERKACLCHYNAHSGLCTLFNKSKIARFNDLRALLVTEVDESAARNLLQEYKEGVGHLKGLIENMERQRNAFLNMR